MYNVNIITVYVSWFKAMLPGSLFEVVSETAEQEVMGSIPGWVLLGFPSELPSHGVWICARFMSTSSPTITWDLKT